MSLQHFFLEDQDFACEAEAASDGLVVLKLSAEDLHHAKVLRLKVGEHIGVIDSNQKYFRCEIVDFQKELIVKNVTVTTRSLSQTPAREMTLAVGVWLCQGVVKGSKFDDIVRACTEVGVCGFIPVEFDRCVSKMDSKKANNKTERWQKIAKSAAMQSGQFAIPKISEAVNVKTLCNILSDFDCVFICWEEAKSMKEIVDVCEKLKANKEAQKIAIVIGPEGGITEDEVKQLKASNKDSHVVSIGNSILRTETAGVVASAIIKFNLTC